PPPLSRLLLTFPTPVPVPYSLFVFSPVLASSPVSAHDVLTSDIPRDATPVRAHVSPVERSRLGVYAAIGASAGAVPLPWIPDVLVRRVRGALVHDVAVRPGL